MNDRLVRFRMLLLVAWIGLACLPGLAKADFLYAVPDGGPNIYRIDPATGQTTLVGNTGPAVDGPEDIVRDANGNLIVVSYVPGINSPSSFKTTFSRLDPITFLPTVLGTATNYEFVEGLAQLGNVL